MADLTKSTMKFIHKRDEGICKICHTPVGYDDWNIDHIIPQSWGGTSLRSNLRLSHEECNRLRGDDFSDTEKKKMLEDQLAMQSGRCYLCHEALSFRYTNKIAPDYRKKVSWVNMALAHKECRVIYNSQEVEPWNDRMKKLKGACIRKIIGIE